MSSAIHAESPRISGVPDGVRVLDIAGKSKRSLSKDERSPECRAIAKKHAALNAEREVRRQEAALLDDSARMVTSSQGKVHGTDVTMSGDRILDFVDKVVQRKLAVRKALRNLDEEIEQLEDKLATLRQSRKGVANAVITATVIASSDCTVNLQLTYLVAGVNWRPSYDLHAISVDGQPSTDVSMRYCATISQHTGEDWNDTALTLSTVAAQAQRYMSVPLLHPLKLTVLNQVTIIPNGGPYVSTVPMVPIIPPAPVDTQLYTPPAFVQPPVTVLAPPTGGVPPQVIIHPLRSPQPPQVEIEDLDRSRNWSDSGSSTGATGASYSRSGSPLPGLPTVPQVTSSTRSSLSVAFHVEDTMSIPSDGEDHRLTVAFLDFKANMKYISVPRHNPTVYIVANLENTSEYDLLPGTVNVFMNDSFVTKAFIDFITVNESFECVLGVDTSIKVSYQKEEKTAHEPRRNSAEPQNTTTRTMITTITNRHSFDIAELVVREAVPLGSENDRLHVVLRKPAGLAEAKDGQTVLDRVETEDDEAVKTKVRWTTAMDGRGGEKDGLFKWVCAIPAGKELSLESQWDVNFPVGLDWAESVAASGHHF
ncbi:hypothetical protein BN946_scf185010.g57 [Trametes cinnabarina]|uniref:DUF4139 domain-containing protein n=1 Tax=Pycnoporus cinnabarinus TaxID=5643 RepID=A0A060SKS7_PYCCI|nr:hypothetical protein BN946_scf185010.g57 [Trametes cinnabarina]